MFFNSIDFAIFLPIVFILYWFVTSENLRLQNVLIVGASYFFYGWWDWRFLSLILFSTVVDFIIGYGLKHEVNPSRRRLFLWVSIVTNLGFLGFFKYFDFFVENFVTAFSFFGVSIDSPILSIVLPVGISFYTFQTLSYTIDVYKRKLEPTTDFIAFAAFVSFFPQLVAGPIERATNLLPQFIRKREFDFMSAANGMRQILWGLFKKIVIADNCAEISNYIFSNYENLNGSTLLFGAIFFSFQIYCDFSGYSDIAIGTSRLFGFNLMKNFAFPYFSRDIAEFWRRWHISLSTWFRDYLYIPLGGSRVSTAKKVRNTFIIFGVSGFWHGANWTFIIWGLLNAVYFLPLLINKRNRKNLDEIASGRLFPSIREFLSILSTFGLTTVAWIFFRAESVTHAIQYLNGMFSGTLIAFPQFSNGAKTYLTLILLIGFIIIEWIGRDSEYGIEKLVKVKSRFVRWVCYCGILFVIYFFGNFSESIEFIYFQF